MDKYNINTIFWTALAVLLFLSSLAMGANDVVTAYQSNGTSRDMTPIWTEYQNVSLDTGTGNTSIYLSAVVSTNSTQAKLFGRIKHDGAVVETITLSRSIYSEVATYVGSVTETAGTHNYTFEAYCTEGKLCTIYNATLSVQNLKTGDYASLSEVNSSAQVTRSQVTGQEGVDTGQNTTIVTLQGNDTTDQAFVNITFPTFNWVNVSTLLSSIAQVSGLQEILNAINISAYTNRTYMQGITDGINITLAALQVNSTYFNGSVFPNSTQFNNRVNVTANITVPNHLIIPDCAVAANVSYSVCGNTTSKALNWYIAGAWYNNGTAV